MNYKIGFIGGGNMSQAVLKGILKKKIFKKEEILVSEPNQDIRRQLQQELQIECVNDNKKVFKECLTIVLGVKPFVFPKVKRELNEKLKEEQGVLSVMSGVTMQELQESLGTSRVVRSMPNTPALVGQGITFYLCNRQHNDLETLAQQILNSLGRAERVEDEDMINRGCAIYGGGPAYIAMFLESLVDASVRLGFSRIDSQSLVGQLVKGCVQMYSEYPHVSFDVFRAQVTTPQGTTAEALYQYELANIRAASQTAVMAAYLKTLQQAKPKL